ncbi:magnesium/cobalt transport protein CorA, putative [Entamoeba histolytica HM-1:IMSS-B]|uniref:Magnesium/cobalt transport protein CorA, putative n=2 Tax=Entamoeba histolytica (strain ATCC 30459 / HM-1:IMSS / ABRM) TaxID=294381 RepID=M3SC90_ENTH1|nr:magnesium/cobalt transport protein CorA, putative [Entamoeba histolytica HM-1:IMSS-B]ENY64753.1 magnesium and cobalt transport protein CorA, putative [Entamoeba histolytica HM-1:IMSS-A]
MKISLNQTTKPLTEKNSIQKYQWFDDYISNNRGGSFGMTVITLNGRGHCNEEISLEELQSMMGTLQPKNDDPDADIWIDVHGNNEKELKTIGELFGIHPLTIDDWLSDSTRSKSTIFDTYYELSDKELFYQTDSNILDYSSINITMRDTFVLTVHSKHLHAIKKVKDKISLHYTESLPSAQWVMYALLMDIIKGYKLIMKHIEEDLDTFEKLAEFMISTDQNAILARLMSIKKRASNLDYQISPKKALLRYLIKTPTQKISKMVKIYLRDVLEEAVIIVKRVDFVNDKIDDVTNTFLSRMTLDSYRVNRDQEELMKRFAIITTLFTPLTFLSTSFGMNVLVPGQEIDNYGMFIGLYVIAIAAMIGGISYFKLTHWI